MVTAEIIVTNFRALWYLNTNSEHQAAQDASGNCALQYGMHLYHFIFITSSNPQSFKLPNQKEGFQYETKKKPKRKAECKMGKTSFKKDIKRKVDHGKRLKRRGFEKEIKIERLNCKMTHVKWINHRKRTFQMCSFQFYIHYRPWCSFLSESRLTSQSVSEMIFPWILLNIHCTEKCFK